MSWDRHRDQVAVPATGPSHVLLPRSSNLLDPALPPIPKGVWEHSVFKLPFEGQAGRRAVKSPLPRTQNKKLEPRLSEMGSVRGVSLCKHLRHN